MAKKLVTEVEPVTWYRATCPRCGWVGNVQEWHHIAAHEAATHVCPEPTEEEG